MTQEPYYQEISDYHIDVHHRNYVPPYKTKADIKRYNLLCRALKIEDIRRDKDLEKRHNQYFKNVQNANL